MNKDHDHQNMSRSQYQSMADAFGTIMERTAAADQAEHVFHCASCGRVIQTWTGRLPNDHETWLAIDQERHDRTCSKNKRNP